MTEVFLPTDSNTLLNASSEPKFSDVRSRVMLGDLPQDFLRLQHLDNSLYNASILSQGSNHNANYLGFLTLTIAEAKLVKNSGPLGLLRMDPYVRFRLGHLVYETPTASGGGKNPQWKVTYRMNLFRGMGKIHLEVYDQRNFTEDSFIGECDIDIPNEVLSGSTSQHWYSLMGRDSNANENQGDILVIMSLAAIIPDSGASTENESFPIDMPMSSSSTSSQSNSISETAPIYSLDDVRTIEEMFPSVDRQLIINLLDKHGGSKDLAVNELLQSTAE